ncbi:MULTISPECIES: hypothetical protein [unclassified Pseudomonas]|uniref:hypothetical protein n=1 Tax=unclassified Pseudomonas TaxID=196821 RepID=UPI002AC9C02B|nr:MULTISPECIES: hypothetical protein [unclassified Pseudomonas]MEB0044728.1 hypothetical protein [Pseudomonas sp. Dout3]MEB0096305.1 hypothetical protein [Pseudomonas sp. DC1.2]WPX59297.1 hypothetical protein RHM68_01190 [Pseudomonas sp. DC1.2]
MKSGHALLCSLTLLAGMLTPACAMADSLGSVTSLMHWQVEKPDAENPYQMALLDGKASYGSKTSQALLQVGCHAHLSLIIPTQRLGFNADAYEGPNATLHGPLRMSTARRAHIDYRISGFGSVRRLQDDGWVFEFAMSASKSELRFWLTKAAIGQLVTLTVPSTQKGDKPLIAKFILPTEASGLREVLAPCLNGAK